MTERMSSATGGTYGKMDDSLGPKKTALVLVVVVGCFAILWPKVFYPMLVGNSNPYIKPSAIDKTTGCCDVISELDVKTLKIMSKVCDTIVKDSDKLTNKQILQICRTTILDTCGIDVSAVLQEQVRLGQTTKQIINEVRSMNGSLCLKYNFGVAPWKLGVPHRIHKSEPIDSIRQERPLNVRSEMIHPAFRERGRAIPQAEPTFAAPRPSPRIVEGRPGPIPGLRPTIGGAGHVVPPRQNVGGMGMIMPLYTIAIVIFFTYTVMKLLFKKKADGQIPYPPIESDPNFRREVFEVQRPRPQPKHSREIPPSKLGDIELDHLRRRLRETEEAMKRVHSQLANCPFKKDNLQSNGNLRTRSIEEEDDQSRVQVVGYELTASCEGDKKWTHNGAAFTPRPPTPSEKLPPPQEIYLEGSLPAQSHLLVSDSAAEAQEQSEADPAVVLAGKMTLSVISLDSSENGTDESSNSDKKIFIVEDDDFKAGTGSSNGSEDFEKIEVDQLGEEIKQTDLVPTQIMPEDHIDNKQFNISRETPILTDVKTGFPKTAHIERMMNEKELLQLDESSFVDYKEGSANVVDNIEQAKEEEMRVKDDNKELIAMEENVITSEVKEVSPERALVGEKIEVEEIPRSEVKEEESIDNKEVNVLAENIILTNIQELEPEHAQLVVEVEPKDIKTIVENITEVEEIIEIEQKPVLVEEEKPKTSADDKNDYLKEDKFDKPKSSASSGTVEDIEELLSRDDEIDEVEYESEDDEEMVDEVRSTDRISEDKDTERAERDISEESDEEVEIEEIVEYVDEEEDEEADENDISL